MRGCEAILKLPGRFVKFSFLRAAPATPPAEGYDGLPRGARHGLSPRHWLESLPETRSKMHDQSQNRALLHYIEDEAVIAEIDAQGTVADDC